MNAIQEMLIAQGKMNDPDPRDPSDYRYKEDETIPCTTCQTPTRMLGTKLCDRCWEFRRAARTMTKEQIATALAQVQAEKDAYRGK